jgi:sterol-4alpha-carboxylate 3-dehydrogenase (decarboxylating)
MYKVNVDGTDNLLNVARETGVKAFVYTSSASVIMDKENDVINADERWPVISGKEQPEYYTHTKGLAETAVLLANRTPPTFLTCSIRPAGIFGPGDVQMLPGLLQASRKGQTKFQLGPNTSLFDFTYVENVAHGHLLGLIHLLETSKRNAAPLDDEKVDGEAFFISNGSPVYFWDFARRVWKEAGDKNALYPAKAFILGTNLALTIASILGLILGIFGKEPSLNRTKVRYSTMTRYYSIQKAQQRLGYEPIVELEEGIKRGMKDILEREAAAQKSLNEKKAL